MIKYYKLGIISTHKCNQQCYYCNNYDTNYYSNDITRNIKVENYDGAYYRLKDLKDNGLNNRYCDSYISNAFISSNGILSKCFQYRNSFNLNLCEKENIIDKYKNICKLKFKCYIKTCYEFANWSEID